MSITSTVVERAEIRFIEAADVLQPYVGCFWVLTAARDATLRLVPDGSTAISIEEQNERSSGWLLRGPLVRPEERRFASPATLIGVRLCPGVAFLVTEMPAHAIVGRRVALPGIEVFDAMRAGKPLSRKPEQQVEALQRFLIGRIGNKSVHGVVATALQEIARARGCIQVADVAAHCGVSPRHLNRLMRLWIGYGPKSFARIVRFQETLEQMAHSPGRSGATLASDRGYFDQAHLTLDLAQLAGATPGHLATRRVADFSKTRCNRPL
jgi:AraC-like DNA-binding protein